MPRNYQRSRYNSRKLPRIHKSTINSRRKQKLHLSRKPSLVTEVLKPKHEIVFDWKPSGGYVPDDFPKKKPKGIDFMKNNKTKLIFLLRLMATLNRISDGNFMKPPKYNGPSSTMGTVGFPRNNKFVLRTHNSVIRNPSGKKKKSSKKKTTAVANNLCSNRNNCGTIARKKMPQIENEDDLDVFSEALSSQYNITYEENFDYSTSTVKPTQAEISKLRVDTICSLERLEGNPIILLQVDFRNSADNSIQSKHAIIDGHHRAMALANPTCRSGSTYKTIIVSYKGDINLLDSYSREKKKNFINNTLDKQFASLKRKLPPDLFKGHAF